MTPIIVGLAVVASLPGAGTAVHLGLLGVASIFYRSAPGATPPANVRFLVLVPAHNEEVVIGRTLEALLADRRPCDEVLVVADRCTDATAEIARRFGVRLLERDEHDEPGRAAARQAGLECALQLEWDAIVMIDADSVIEAGFFDACEGALSAGAPALQARSEAALGPRLVDHISLAAASLQGVLMPRGRDRLGLLVRLRGTGMVIRRDVLARFRFRAPASEDLFYSLDMCLAGLRPRHAEDARLRSLNVSSWHDAGVQRVRYEAGRMSAAREFVRPLLERHDAAAIEAAWFLCTPPYAVAVLSLAVGLLLALLAGAAVLSFVLLALLGLLVLVLVLAMLEAKVGWRTWLALLVAPWFVPWKALIQLRALLSVKRGVQTYGATPRG